MNAAGIKNQISRGDIKNIYLFSGPEISEKKWVISLIEQQLKKSGEIDKFLFNSADDSDDSDFFDTLSSGMLFSNTKLVILSSVESVSTKFSKRLAEYLFPPQIESKIFTQKLLPSLKNKNDIELIKTIYVFNEKTDSYIQERLKKNNNKKTKLKVADKKRAISIILASKIINPDTYLILLTETNSKIPTEISNLFDDTNHVIFWEMFENQKHDWINDQFRKRNLFIEKEAVNFILEMIENTKDKLIFEIQKIIALYNKERQNKEKQKKTDGYSGQNVINKEFIEDFLYHSREETPFSLFSLILDTNINNYQENLPRTLEILEKLFLNDERQLFNVFIWSLRKFILALNLYQNEKMPYDKIFSTLRISSKKNRANYMAGFNNYSFEHCSLMFYKLSELDYFLKILPNELKLIKFQEFIINFIYGDIQRSFLQGPLQYYQL